MTHGTSGPLQGFTERGRRDSWSWGHLSYNHTWWSQMCLTDMSRLDSSNGSVVKNPPANAGDKGSIPGPRKFPMLLGHEAWCHEKESPPRDTTRGRLSTATKTQHSQRQLKRSKKQQTWEEDVEASHVFPPLTCVLYSLPPTTVHTPH